METLLKWNKSDISQPQKSCRYIVRGIFPDSPEWRFAWLLTANGTLRDNETGDRIKYMGAFLWAELPEGA